MSQYSGSIPDTLDHGRDWLERAVCRGLDDAMYPDSNEADIAYAKQICRACPVQMACLQDALRIGDNEHGIRGGLRPYERRAVAKRLTREQYNQPAAVAEAVQRVLHPAERTLEEIWEEHTYPLPDGHIGWRGNRTPRYQDGNRTPGWVSFVHDRGREPEGPVRRTCEVEGCANPRHVADNRERWERQQTEPAQAGPEEAPAVKAGGRKLAECGTHSAYQRHVRNKEPIDDACRAANAAAHARYKRSGSTKTATV